MLRCLCLLAVAAGVLAGGGLAANSPDPRLDAVASSVAGKPVTVWCETSEQSWTTSFGAAGDPYGKTFPGQSDVVYLSPLVCNTLHAILTNGYRVIGPYWGSLAIQVLLHESVHQRGIIDESVTDCTAMSLLGKYAVSSFGYPATITTQSQVLVHHQMRVGKKVVRWTTMRSVSTQVPNPDLQALEQWDKSWHSALPAQYQGAC